jgi:formylglycine-generating enzyme required for sulfatase activity/CRP-like cAMP-binding protein
MSAAKKIAEKKILRELVPLNTLSQARFKEISGKIVVEEVRAGSYLFRIDARDKQTVFLLGGEIDLLDEKQKSSGTIKAGSDKSRFPIADAQPRILSAKALKKCVVARIDSSLLDAFLSWDQSNDAEAVAIGANKDEDWMTRMLQSQAFEKIPPATIQQLLLKMDAVRFKAGATVIRQGDPGDSFYTIKSGKCAVTRKDTPQGEDLLLAELADGDCFGEEALVLDVKRNASVSMLTDGVLMRLAKQDFVELLQKPLVRYVNYEKAAQMVDAGAVWVDVRTAEEYDSGAIEDSVNIPLSSVRREMHDLVFNVAYMLCCDTGQYSTSAAFILSHKGFDVYVLEDGLRAIPENIFQHIPASSEAVPEVATGNDGHEQQISTLHEQKQQLESELALAHEQQASLERKMDELAKHEHDSPSEQAAETLSRQTEEWDRERVRLMSANEETQQRVAELQEQLAQAHESNTWDRSGIREELEAVQNERNSLQQQLAAAADDVAGRQQKIDELDGQLASATSSADEQLREMQARLESELAGTHEQQAALERQMDELTKQHEQDRQQLERDAEAHEHSATASQGDAKRLEVSISQQEETINNLQAGKQAAVEALDHQIEEWDGERARLLSAHEETQQRVNELQQQLEQASESNARDQSGMQEKLDELAAMQHEHDSLQQSLAEEKDNAAGKQQKLDALNEQLVSVTGSADEQTQALENQLESMRLQLEEVNLQAAARLEQLNGMQDEMAGIRQEALEISQQKEELQQSLGQRDEQGSAMQQEYEQSLEKAHDDLTRKNEMERELQGQVDRFRKKLDQTNAEFRNERDAARVDIDSVREELHAERSARSAERAEMASRQRELKEQLVAIAAEHEEKIVNHDGAIEQAKLATHEEDQLQVQQMREIQLETEGQLDRVQQELTQAHDEISALVQREKSRRDEESEQLEEGKQQYESALEELQTQTGQLAEERDEALAEQKTLREKVNSLRAEVEVARGLMGNGQGEVEDPAKLRQELTEARSNLLIAVRLRAEAEATGARLREERDALQKQVGNNISLGKPVNIPSSDEEQDDRAVYEAQPVAKSRAGPANIKVLAAAAMKRTRESAGAVTASWRRVAGILGLAVIIIAGLGYGLNAFIDTPAGSLPQAQDNVSLPGPAGPAAPEASNNGPLAEGQDQQAVQETMALVDPAAPVTKDPQGEQVSPSVSKTAQAFDLLKSIVGPAIWSQDKPADEPVVTQLPETGGLPESGEQPVTPQQELATRGSFQDRLKGTGFAPQMVKLPAASYVMGSQGNSLNFDEGPQHVVELPRFAISRHEVTFADYDRFARASGVRLPYDETWGRGNRPVINVSWNDAQAYVRWLSAQTGHTYRLPTESQWEFAARAAELTSWPWDENVDEVHANCFDCGSEWDQSSTAPVGKFSANHFGLYDMGGNVQEWTEDCYRKGYNGAPADGSALQIPECTQHTVRGGAYTSPLTSLRGSSRAQYDRDTRLDNLGFRIIRSY